MLVLLSEHDGEESRVGGEGEETPFINRIFLAAAAASATAALTELASRVTWPSLSSVCAGLKGCWEGGKSTFGNLLAVRHVHQPARQFARTTH